MIFTKGDIINCSFTGKKIHGLLIDHFTSPDICTILSRILERKFGTWPSLTELLTQCGDKWYPENIVKELSTQTNKSINML